MILDLLETRSGVWHSQQQLMDELCERRPGVRYDSVRRSIRVLRSHGGGLAIDRRILGETSTGGLILGGRRSVAVECSTDADSDMLRLRVPIRSMPPD
jgi:hypothetical protein